MFAFLGSPVFHMSCSSDAWFKCLCPLSQYSRKGIHTTLLPLSSDAWYIVTSISYVEHTLWRSWFPIHNFLYSWDEFLQNKTIYHTCSPNIKDILLLLFLAWKGRGHLWNKSMYPHHALPLGKDAHKTSIIHCLNSGWKLPSTTSLLISVSLCMCHTDLTCFNEVYFTVLSFQL